MKNLMIDIETISLRPNAVVWSIGIQPFSFVDGLPVCAGRGEFHYLDPTEQMERVAVSGAHISETTVQWTMTHGDANTFAPWYARFQAEFSNGPQHAPGNWPYACMKVKHLHQLLSKLASPENDCLFWAKGKEFDLGILKHMFAECQMPPPWHYRNAMCMRTMDGILRSLGVPVPKISGGHNAIADAQAQVKGLAEMMQLLAGAMIYKLEVVPSWKDADADAAEARESMLLAERDQILADSMIPSAKRVEYEELAVRVSIGNAAQGEVFQAIKELCRANERLTLMLQDARSARKAALRDAGYSAPGPSQS